MLSTVLICAWIPLCNTIQTEATDLKKLCFMQPVFMCDDNFLRKSISYVLSFVQSCEIWVYELRQWSCGLLCRVVL
jgi:hypothetical protein